jgi:hypothetical protein
MGQQAAVFECQDSCIPRGCRDLSLKPSETMGQHCANEPVVIPVWILKNASVEQSCVWEIAKYSKSIKPKIRESGSTTSPFLSDFSVETRDATIPRRVQKSN